MCVLTLIITILVSGTHSGGFKKAENHRKGLDSNEEVFNPNNDQPNPGESLLRLGPGQAD